MAGPRSRSDDGPLLVSIGVFDGLHLGHAWLLEHLVREARLRGARPAVITFDAHPDAILLGQAPPLLMDPDERLERLAALGVEVVVIEHFDDALRRTPYDAFVARDHPAHSARRVRDDPRRGIRPRACRDAGRGRGARPPEGFDVVLVPPFTLDGREVRSSDIRTAIATGDLVTARRLLGRPYAVSRACLADGAVVLRDARRAAARDGAYPTSRRGRHGSGPDARRAGQLRQRRLDPRGVSRPEAICPFGEAAATIRRS